MNHEEIWKTVLADIETRISQAGFITWFKQTSVVDIKDNTAFVSVPNGFAREWLQNKYNKFVLEAFRSTLQNTAIKHVEYVIAKPADTDVRVAEIPQKKKKEERNEFLKDSQLEIKEFRVDPITNLNPRYTFSNFVIGGFNEIAHAAVQTMLQNIGHASYNPLFIYGGVGLGKTHLIQALGNELLKRSPGIKVNYVTSEKFMSEVIEAYGSLEKMEIVKERYRTVDLWIVDDIQFLARGEKVQEDFFHTFNALYNKNKQIVISSDRPPKAIATLEERLKSRFEGGTPIDIGVPDFETRTLILKMKAREKQFAVSDDIIEFIANSIKTNIRELEGALNRLIIHTKMSNAPLTLDEAKKILSSASNTIKKFTTPKKIIRAVADFYDIKEQELLNKSRKQHIVKPRQIVMYLLRNELLSSFPSIGEYLGGRDHSTVIHACEKVSQDLKNNLLLEEELRSIKDRIYKL